MSTVQITLYRNTVNIKKSIVLIYLFTFYEKQSIIYLKPIKGASMKKTVEESDFEFRSEPQTFQTENIIDELLLGLPNSEGYYIKLYKEIDTGKWELKEKIIDYESWSDLEVEIKNLVTIRSQKNPRKWGSGNYKVMVFKEGRQGFVKKPINMSIDANETALAPETDVKNKLSEVGEFIKQVKEIMPEQSKENPPPPPHDAKLIAETFKSGVDMARSFIPHQEKITQEKTQNPLDLITGILALMEKMGLIGNKIQQPQQDPFYLI